MVDVRYSRSRPRTGGQVGRLGVLGVVCLALVLPGCSVKRMAIKMVADSLSQGTLGFATDETFSIIYITIAVDEGDLSRIQDYVF
jgi:hypothetical protein